MLQEVSSANVATTVSSSTGKSVEYRKDRMNIRRLPRSTFSFISFKIFISLFDSKHMMMLQYQCNDRILLSLYIISNPHAISCQKTGQHLRKLVNKYFIQNKFYDVSVLEWSCSNLSCKYGMKLWFSIKSQSVLNSNPPKRLKIVRR